MKIMLIHGGLDVEGEVSVKSATNIRLSLNKLGYEICDVVFDTKTIQSQIKSNKCDVVFNAMHGKWGEDGILPKILDYEQIPYTHSGYLASSIGINKFFTYSIATSLGIKTAKNRYLVSKDSLLKGFIHKTINNPNGKIIIKPNSQGSSVGCYFFDKNNILKNNGILKLNNEQQSFIMSNTEQFYIVEDAFDGFELTSGIFNEKHIGLIKINPKSQEFYNYTAKYTAGQTNYEVNPHIKPDITKQIIKDTIAIHNAIGANMISRCDFLVNNDQNDYVFLEINTHPGFTATSLVPKMIEANYNNLEIFKIYDENFNDKILLQKLSYYDKMVDMLVKNAKYNTI